MRVNPNRMELLRLRKRYALTLRGHRMLKDKLDGLVKEFLQLARDYKELRTSIDRELPEVLRPFVLARLSSPTDVVSTALEEQEGALELRLRHWRILNVVLTDFEASPPPPPTYSLLDTASSLDTAVKGLRDYLPRILKLAGLEHTVRLVARELEETRRRVNALEYVLIPELKESIKFIKAKLDEMERFHISRLMKVKEMLESRKAVR